MPWSTLRILWTWRKMCFRHMSRQISIIKTSSCLLITETTWFINSWTKLILLLHFKLLEIRFHKPRVSSWKDYGIRPNSYLISLETSLLLEIKSLHTSSSWALCKSWGNESSLSLRSKMVKKLSRLLISVIMAFSFWAVYCYLSLRHTGSP